MIALKSVKTLPATMLEVEREEVSGGGPSLRRRCSPPRLLGETLRLGLRRFGHGGRIVVSVSTGPMAKRDVR